MVYLTHYEQYPIYEPAEGGYYYAGNQVVESERLSLRQAKKQLKKLWAEADAENVNDFGATYDELASFGCVDDRGNTIYPWQLITPLGERPYIYKGDRYIGNAQTYVIERKLGSQIRGWEPYC